MKIIQALCIFVLLSSNFLIYSSDDSVVRLLDGTTPEKFTAVLTGLRERLMSSQLEDVSVHPEGVFVMRATSVLLGSQEENNVDCIVHVVANCCQEEVVFELGGNTFHRYAKGFTSQRPYVVIAEGSHVHIAESFERDV